MQIDLFEILISEYKRVSYVIHSKISIAPLQISKS